MENKSICSFLTRIRNWKKAGGKRMGGNAKEGRKTLLNLPGPPKLPKLPTPSLNPEGQEEVNNEGKRAQ